MFCIQVIHRSGGSNSVVESTIEACKRRAAVFQGGNHVATTVPFEVFVAPPWRNVYDVSIPEDIRQGLGEDLLKLYLQAD